MLCQGEDGNECHKRIEEVEVGDYVWAYDEKTGESDWKPVVRLFRNQTKEWYHVHVNDEEIVCTAEHPFYVIGKGFTAAKNLSPTDKLLLSNGKTVEVDAVSIEKLEEPETTYNFEVEDFHTYYVSESNVLHNACRGRHRLRPDSEAKDAHSAFYRDPVTGKVTHYATYEPNPLNPSGFDEVLRFDAIGLAHMNPNGVKVPTPHIHEGKWARPPLPITTKIRRKFMDNILEWLATWFKQNCDGEWEHNSQLKIETLDNPGWSVIIDLTDTELENKNFESVIFHKTSDDWLICRVENNIFRADGDIDKLGKMLSVFKSWAES